MDCYDLGGDGGGYRVGYVGWVSRRWVGVVGQSGPVAPQGLRGGLASDELRGNTQVFQ